MGDTRTIAADEAKDQFSDLLERVAGGEEVIITQHGQPVARLAPIQPKSTLERRREAIRRIRELGSTLSLGDVTIRELMAEGRR